MENIYFLVRLLAIVIMIWHFILFMSCGYYIGGETEEHKAYGFAAVGSLAVTYCLQLFMEMYVYSFLKKITEKKKEDIMERIATVIYVLIVTIIPQAVLLYNLTPFGIILSTMLSIVSFVVSFPVLIIMMITSA